MSDSWDSELILECCYVHRLGGYKIVKIKFISLRLGGLVVGYCDIGKFLVIYSLKVISLFEVRPLLALHLNILSCN